jgi:hypothetical protein
MSTTLVYSGWLLALLAVVVVVLVLQIFLSRTERKLPGLIMPIIWLAISLIAPVRILLLGTDARTFEGIVNGEAIVNTPSMISIIGEAVFLFVIFNVLTGILIAIYAICKGKQNKQRALLKMNLQDLG